MNSIVGKYWIIAVFFISLQCVVDPESKLHPAMTLQEKERINDTSQVIIATTVAKDHSLYLIDQDTCVLIITKWALVNGLDSIHIDSIPVVNDPGAKEGTFYGIGKVPWGIPENQAKADSMQIYGGVLDESKHEVCETILLYKEGNLSPIRY